MPSAAAKRRKAAAQKKKNLMAPAREGVDAPRGVDSQVPESASGVPEGDDDLKTQEERDSDSSGETGSPASRDQHYPFGQGVGECEKRGAPAEPVDGSVLEAVDDDSVVEEEVNDEKDSEDSAGKGLDAANGCQNPVSIEELVQSDLQGIPVEEVNGNTHGEIDGVEKVYSGLEDLDLPHPSEKTDGGLNELSFPSGTPNKNLLARDGNILDVRQSFVLTDGSVEIVNGVKREDDSEEKIIDSPGSGLPVVSDNCAEEVKKDLIAELSLPSESTGQVDLLPETTSLEEAPVTSIADLASPLIELDDSCSVLKEQKDGFSSAVHVVSEAGILISTENKAEDKFLPLGYDETGNTKDGEGEQMLSSGCLIAEAENGAEMCDDATLPNNDAVSVLEENSVAKLENGSDTSNLPANGVVAALKENGHGDILITGDDIVQDGGRKEKNDLEGAHDDIDNQIELPKAARVVRKTSWMGCCGLLDVITGSVR